MSRVTARRIVLAPCSALAVTLLLSSEIAHSETDGILRAANYCSGYKKSIKLSEDNTILCFDGKIEADVDMEPFYELKNDGFFVIRSPGGNIVTAMKFSNILLEKDATVIVSDYCLSACANAIFIAAKETYVLKDSIIAWHGGIRKLNCYAPDRAIVMTLKDDSELKDQMERLELYCKNLELFNEFFRRRGIDDGFTHTPQTLYTKKMFNVALKSSTTPKGSVFWMWNPKNYGNYFKTKITFESYPDSQYTVNEIIRRLRLPIRIIYDPEE